MTSSRMIAVVASGVLAAGMSSGASAQSSMSRNSYQMAAGGCVPFSPTAHARYSASGLGNAGSSMFYVVCSLSGAADNASNGDGQAYEIEIMATNSTGAPQAIACSARPGLAQGGLSNQLVSTRSVSIPATSPASFMWDTGDFSGGSSLIPSPNFTCALYPGVSINWTKAYFIEFTG